jgi:hypothetical protein
MSSDGRAFRYAVLWLLACVAGVLGLAGGFCLVYWTGHLLDSDKPGFYAGQGGQFAYFLAALLWAPFGAAVAACVCGLAVYRVLLWPPSSDPARQAWRKRLRIWLPLFAGISAVAFVALVWLAHIAT